MNLTILILLAIGLSMDAFAVSISKGHATKKVTFINASVVGLWFSSFQVLMPALGYFIGYHTKSYLINISHWIIFFALALIGANMLKQSGSRDEEDVSDTIHIKEMLPISLATSIDAFAAGFSVAMLPNVSIRAAILITGSVTFILAILGMVIGKKSGLWFRSKAQLIGGLILIGIGCKLLIDAVGIQTLTFGLLS